MVLNGGEIIREYTLKEIIPLTIRRIFTILWKSYIGMPAQILSGIESLGIKPMRTTHLLSRHIL